MQPAVHPPVQYVHSMQAWSRFIDSGLAVLSQSYIEGISISIYVTSMVADIQVCMSPEDTRAEISEAAEQQMLQAHITRGWLQNKGELRPSSCWYWPIKHDLMV